jgi:uncharacterized protein (TIGR02246 family)
MHRVLLALLLVPSLALAQDKPAAASEDPMAGWTPPKVKNEAKDRKEIMAVFKAMETAGRKGDLEAAAALVDFPVMMMTDDSKGQGMGAAWTREQWVEVMRPFYEKPMKDMKITHKPTVFLLSDSLASVDDVCTMSMGGKTVVSRNSTFLVRASDGQWKVKAMAEGGWGDMMGAQGHDTGTASGATTGTTGTATGATGDSSGATGASSGATGSSPGATGSSSGGTGVSEPPGATSGEMGRGSGATPPPSGTNAPPQPTTK